MHDQHSQHHGSADQPQPGRESRNDAAAVQKTGRSEVEEIEKETRISQSTKERMAGQEEQSLANGSAQGAQQRPADSYPSFHPSVFRCFLEGDQRAHERYKHGSTYL